MEWIKDVGRSDGMGILQRSWQSELHKTLAIPRPKMQGLAGWALDLLRRLRGQPDIEQRQLRLVETLPLGGKRQLMLVTCAGESFLIGGGLESVETIVRVRAEVSLDAAAKSRDESCR
jgi:flagellar biogenesis protein FliO